MTKSSTFEHRALGGLFVLPVALGVLCVFCSGASQLRLPTLRDGIWNVSKTDKVASADFIGKKIDTQTETSTSPPPATADAGEFNMFFAMRPILLDTGAVLTICSMLPCVLLLAYMLTCTAIRPQIIIDNTAAVVPVVALLLCYTICDFTSTTTWYVDLVMVLKDGKRRLAGVQRGTTSVHDFDWPRLCFSYTIATLASLLIVAQYEAGSFEQRQELQVVWNTETAASGIWRNNISKKVDFVTAVVMDYGTVILPKLPFVVGIWSEIYKPTSANCPSFGNDVLLACWALFMLSKVTLQKADLIRFCQTLQREPGENLREDGNGNKYQSCNMNLVKLLARRAERVQQCYRWLDRINKFFAWVLFSGFHLWLHSNEVSPLDAIRCTYLNSACTARDSACTTTQKHWAVHDCVANVLCYIFCVTLSNVLCRMYIFNIPTEPVFDGRLGTEFNENRVINPDGTSSFRNVLFMNFHYFMNLFGHMPGQSGDASNDHVLLVKTDAEGKSLYGETSRQPDDSQRGPQQPMHTHTRGQGINHYGIQTCHVPHKISDARPTRQKSQVLSQVLSPRQQQVDNNEPDPRLKPVTEQFEADVTITEQKTELVQWVFAGTALLACFPNLNPLDPTSMYLHWIELGWALASGFLTFDIEVDHNHTTRTLWECYHVYVDWRAYNITYSRWLASPFYMYQNGDLVRGEVSQAPGRNASYTDDRQRRVVKIPAPQTIAGGNLPRMCIPIHPSRRTSYEGFVCLVLALALFSHACYNQAHREGARARNEEDAWKKAHNDLHHVCGLDTKYWQVFDEDNKPLLHDLCDAAYRKDHKPFMDKYSEDATDFRESCVKYCQADSTYQVLKQEDRFCASNMKGVCFRLGMLDETINDVQPHQAFTDHREQSNMQNLLWFTCITAVLYLGRVVLQNDCLQHLPLVFAATTVAGYMLKDFLTDTETEPKRYYDLMIPCLGSMLATQFLHFKTAPINIAALNWGTVHVIFWIIMHVLPTGANMWLDVARFCDMDTKLYGVILLLRTALQYAVLVHLSRQATHIMLVQYESFESSRAQLLGIAVCAVFVTVAEMVPYAHNREAVSTHQFQCIVATAVLHTVLFCVIRMMLLTTGPENIWGCLTREKHVLNLNEHIKNVLAGIQNMLTGMSNTSLANNALQTVVPNDTLQQYGIPGLQGIVNAQLLCRMTRNDNSPMTTIINSAKILLYRLEVQSIADICQTIYTWWLAACLIGRIHTASPKDSFGPNPLWEFSSINQWAYGRKYEITGEHNSPLLFVYMRLIYISAEITLNLWNMISI